MSRYIKLNGVFFTNPDLPIARDLSTEVESLPGLTDWFTASPIYVTGDPSGKVSTWTGRAANTTFTAQFPDKPSLITDPENGTPGIQFTDLIVMPLVWSGTFPTGPTASGTFTKIVIAKLQTAGDVNNKFVLGYWNNPAVNNGYHHIRYEPGTGVIGSVIDPNDGGGSANITAPTLINNKPSLIGSSFDPVSQKNSAMVNGQVNTVTYSGSALVEESLLWLGNIGGPGDTLRTPEMIVYDVMIFNTDLIGDPANAASLGIIREYAKSKLGIV